VEHVRELETIRGLAEAREALREAAEGGEAL
jgi:hypothetical protein